MEDWGVKKERSFPELKLGDVCDTVGVLTWLIWQYSDGVGVYRL